MNFYNEKDEKAAAWLRELIKQGVLAPGVVDTRDIRDIKPQDLAKFTQCHFFAGIGGWPYALDLAGWPRNRPCWTGSCPCQAFSAAGKGAGFDDERHLWPAFDWLIDQCRPENLFGEQVASSAGLLWLDLVQADLEGKDYAFWSSDLCAAGVSAPHLRQRLWWLGVSDSKRRKQGWFGGTAVGHENSTEPTTRNGSVADPAGVGSQGRSVEIVLGARGWNERNAAGRSSGSLAGQLADGQLPQSERRSQERNGLGSASTFRWSGAAPVNWRDCDWLSCKDGKWRPVEPGTFPLADGISGRMGLLRGYGNAIVPIEAAEFIATYLDIERTVA